MKNIFLVLFSFWVGVVHGQDSILVKERIVIATKLNFREKPDLNSKIIAKLPFNTKVEVLSVFDTIQYSEPVYEYDGAWAKIKFQNKIGFVAEYYLGQLIDLQQYGGNPISMNYKYWYKIEKTKDGDFLKQIKVKLRVFPANEAEGTSFSIIENSEKKLEVPELLFGTNEKLRTGKIGTFYSYCIMSEYVGYNCYGNSINSKNPNLRFEKDERFKNYQLELNGQDLFLKNNEKKQLVKRGNDFNVEWYGDFDFDNKPDFILYTFGTQSLFLSSKAEKDKIVKLVSRYEFLEGD